MESKLKEDILGMHQQLARHGFRYEAGKPIYDPVNSSMQEISIQTKAVLELMVSPVLSEQQIVEIKDRVKKVKQMASRLIFGEKDYSPSVMLTDNK
jgi:hypothetical protein